MPVTLGELEECFRILMDHARRRGITQLEFKNDLYWTVVSSEWLNVYVEPKPAVGSLRDDHQELRKLIDDPSRASAVDFERLAHLMSYLSDELVK